MAVRSPFSATPRSPTTLFSPQEDADVVWKRMLHECQKVTKWDLNDKNVLSVEEVVAKIHPPKKDEKRATKDNAKTAVRSALICVQRFGQIASQGASMVFGPSQQCFNAVSFVISATQDYSAVFENLTALMERLAAFLERLRMYLDDPTADVKLDPRLRKSVYRVLGHFVMVMGLAHKLTSSLRGKVKLGLKVVLFGEDQEVKNALKELETIVSDVTRTEITVIAKDLTKAAKDIRGFDKKIDQIVDAQERAASSLGHLQAAEDRRADADKEQKETEMLRKAFGIEERREPWQDRQEELSRNRVPHTGRWLKDFYISQRWTDPTQTSVNIATLKAQQNFGKSFLCSAIVDHLHKRHRTNPRVAVAYYYFHRDQTENRDSTRDSINRAFKAIMWQFTQVNREVGREFRKFAVQTCESKPDFSKTLTLWKSLINAQEDTLKATFYVILDGLDDIESESDNPLATIVNQLLSLSDSKALDVRMLISGRQSGLTELQQSIDHRLPQIDMILSSPPGEPAVNEDDIMLFTANRLSNFTIFQNLSGDPEMVNLREKVKITLARGVHGDYFTLTSKLNEINQARTVDQVDEILNRASEDRIQVIERQIKQLNDTLTPEEIGEVNDLLVWIIAAFRRLTVEALENMLRLKANRMKSLVSLRKQIEERYSTIFVLEEAYDDAMLNTRSDEIQDYLLKADESADGKRAAKSKRTGQGLQDAEIALMERIIKTHLKHTFGDGPDMYERYNFAEFFESKRGATSVRIHYKAEFAHVEIAQACLVALCDKFDDAEYGALHDYAFASFADHLNVQTLNTGLERIDRPIKRHIGQKLVRLLRETTFIEAWAGHWIRNQDGWVNGNYLCEVVLQWLRDPAIQNGFQDMPSERKWVSSLMSDDILSTQILSSVAKKVANIWFLAESTSSEEWQIALTWIYGYYNQLQGRYYMSIAYASVLEFDQLEAWAKEQLANEQEVAQWHFCVGVSLQLHDHWDEAISRLQQALHEQPHLWRAQWAIALSFSLMNDLPEAIATLEDLLQKNSARLEQERQFTNNYWSDMLPALVDWNTQARRYEAAEQVATKLLKRGLNMMSSLDCTHSAARNLFFVQCEQKKYSSACATIINLASKSDSVNGNWLIYFLYRYYADFRTHDLILSAAGHAENPRDLIGHYLEATRTELEPQDSEDPDFARDEMNAGPFRLRFYLARMMYFHGTDADRENALSIWEELAKTEPADDHMLYHNVNETRKLSACWLAPSLLTRARETGLDSPRISNYIQRMETLITMDHYIVRDPDADTRLALSRLLYLLKEYERARNTIRDFLSVALQLLRESEGKNVGAALRAAYAFQALEDDNNAVAMYGLSMFEPVKESDVAMNGNDEHSQESPRDGKPLAQKESDPATKSSVVDNEAQAQSGADIERQPDPGPHDIEPAASVLALTKIDTTQPVPGSFNDESAPRETPKEPFRLSCTACDIKWSPSTKFRACRDCLAILCQDCYDKLQEGNLDSKWCEKIHSHLILPQYQEQAWRRRPHGSLIVAEKIIPFQDWLESIKKDWGLEHNHTEARERFQKAVRAVQLLVRLNGPPEQNGVLQRTTSADPGPLPPLPEGWIAHFDDTSGNYYYIHVATRSTQWEFPTGPRSLAPVSSPITSTYISLAR